MIEKIANGRTDLIFDFLAKGNNARSTDQHGTPLIRWCAYYGDVSAIKQLLAHDESLESLGENFDLNGAVFHRHWPLVQFLLESGADPNHELPDTKETPLHAATTKGNHPATDFIIELLLHHGAAANAKTRPGIETGSFMRDCTTKGETPLHRAGAFCSQAAIGLLLAAEADKTAKDANGDTPLGWASWYQRPDSVLRLLCYGDHWIHPQRGEGLDPLSRLTTMESHLLGKPHM